MLVSAASLPLPAHAGPELRRLFDDPTLVRAEVGADAVQGALRLAQLVAGSGARVGLALGGLVHDPAGLGLAAEPPSEQPRARGDALLVPLLVPLAPSGKGARRPFGVLGVAPVTQEVAPRLLELGAHVADRLLRDALARAADRDGLTHLATRAAFERATMAVTHTVAEGGRAALLMADVDDLRRVNAARGYRAGDDVLRTLGALLRGVGGDGALACRYGGDELALLLPDADAAAGEALARRLLEATRAIPSLGPGLDASLSIGVAAAPAHGQTCEELVARADQALAQAKRAGKGKVVVWSPDLGGLKRQDRLAGILTGDAARDYRNVEALLETVAAVSRLAPLEDTLTRVVDRCIEVAGAERGLLLLRGGAPQEWTVRVARRHGGQALEGPAGFAASLAAEALAGGRAVQRLSQGEGISTSADALGLTAVLCAPLVGEDVPEGVVYVDARAAVTQFDPATIAFFQALTAEVSTALRNAALYERLVRRARRLEADVAGREAELARLRRTLSATGGNDRYEGIVGASAGMQQVFDLLRSIEGSEAPVLINGESGTGKELVARAIHARSPRRDRPFVGVNCAALAEGVLESELFGHVRGAFTGALEDRAGLFEAAHGGTLFLDEVGELPAAAQAKLLRVLQEGELRRIGDTKTRAVDVRIVAATNRDLPAMVSSAAFREDLFYRLAVLRVSLPPLRERAADLPLLVDHALEELRARGVRAGAPSRKAREELLRRQWRGNVRELKNVLERAAVLAGDGPIEAEHLGDEGNAPQPLERTNLFELTFSDAKAAFSTLYAREVVARAGSIAAAARRAGTSRQTIYRLLGGEQQADDAT